MERFDWVRDFAAYIPMRVFGMLLGISDDDQEVVRKYVEEQMHSEPGKPKQYDDGGMSGEFYADFADVCAREYARLGYVVDVIAAEGHEDHTPAHPRLNVLGRIDGAGAGPCVHFNGHLDVVPPGEGWTHPPYGGEVADGKLYGRAAAVSKSDFASFTFALRALDALVASAQPDRKSTRLNSSH